MVIIAIISLLAAMLLPALAAARKNTEKRRAQQTEQASHTDEYRWLTIGTKVKIDVVDLVGVAKIIQTNDTARPQVTVLFMDKAGMAHTETFDAKLLSPAF